MSTRKMKTMTIGDDVGSLTYEIVDSQAREELSEKITEAELQNAINEAVEEMKSYVDNHSGSGEIPDVSGQINEHNTNDTAHNDIRVLITNLTNRLNSIANSDDTTLDQMAELVAYIKDNRELIESVTTSKVNVSDIIDNLTTTANNKPLSANQGVQLKALIDAIKIPIVPTNVSAFNNDVGYMKSSEQQTVINNALTQAKSSGEFDGADGVGIKSIVRTAGNGAAGTIDTYTVTLTDNSSYPIAVYNGANGAKGDAITVSKVTESTADGGSNVVTFSDGKTVTIKNGSKGSKGDTPLKGVDYNDGVRGFSILKVTTAPTSYTTETGGFTPKYRIALSTVKSQSNATEVFVGDTLAYSYYQYPIGYVDSSYVYLGTRVSIRGSTGAAGAAGKDYSFDPTVYGLPVLYLTGDTTGMSKDVEKTLSYEYDGRSGSCTMKWQGSSSLAWEKKNFTIKFDNAFEAISGWGSQKKYCLKANFIDTTHSRNVVSAKLWGLVTSSRKHIHSKMSTLPNKGAIDGFPVVLMLNNEFYGLYTWNIPKDGWMFGMGSGTKEAVVGADNQADDTAFKAETLLDADGWELEYNSDTFTAEQVKNSLNTLIRACMNSTGSDLDTTVAQYLDWESAIDYYIFAVILQGGDMITKNTLLATYDGVKWYFSAYDMDTTYGLEFDGSKLNRAVTTSHTTFETIADTHRVFELIKRFKTDALKARYKELRANSLSETRICNYFENFVWAIPSPVFMEDVKKWTTIRGSSVNGVDQICRWVRQRLEVTDAWLEALPAQETPVEPEEPVEAVNLVPTSTDTNGTVYNGTGYKDGYRLSSSGSVSGTAEPNATHTGFMKVKKGDIIRIKIVGGFAPSGGGNYICFYNSSFGLIKADYPENWEGGVYGTTETLSDGSVLLTGYTANQTGVTNAVEYFRVSLNPARGANLIVTVNQEITD